ncbi:hypothetical protein C8R43DRAFT_1072179 [Mycena crocata]|nr:hypothetical protein C8R43DRAFT_1072179 [Mycena crocata]
MSTDSAKATTIRDAEEPFSGVADVEDNNPPSDFILRSGDGVDLHVHTNILKHASVFFNNMLDTADSSTAHEMERDGKPVVTLPEPSAVLYRLLRMAYPARSLEHYSLGAQDLDGIWVVHQAANKYLFMDVQVLLVNMLEKMLEKPTIADAQPHRIFAVARLRELPDLARKAALCTLKFPICSNTLDFPELELLTAATFHKLYDFHVRCGIAAQRITAENAGALDPQLTPSVAYEYITTHATNGQELVWWEYGSPGYHSDIECGPRVKQLPNADEMVVLPAQWFQDHAARLGQRLRALPIGQTAKDEGVRPAPAELELISYCHACGVSADGDLADFAEQLAKRIEESNRKLALLL